MKVIMDLVYFHCGPTSGFALSHADFVCRKEDGSFDTGKWKFPKVNFDNMKTREMLYDNMEYFIKKFDVDGYRCGVGGLCPDDFWKEGIRRVHRLKPDFVMVNEGLSRHMVNEIGFDLNCGFLTTVLNVICTILLMANSVRRKLPCTIMKKDYMGGQCKCLRMLDNHDYANDGYDNRPKKTWLRGLRCLSYRKYNA